MPDKAPPDEALAFNYWALILTLLDLGFPWHQIQRFGTQEIALILGVHSAMEQRKAEQEAGNAHAAIVTSSNFTSRSNAIRSESVNEERPS